MKQNRMEFSIKCCSLQEKTLQIKCVTDYICAGEVFPLYKGKMKIFDIDCTKPFHEEGSMIYIHCENQASFILSYKVKIGYLAKHGYAGDAGENILAFSGDQVFTFPVEALTRDDGEKGSFTSSIQILYDIPGEWDAVVPFLMKPEDGDKKIISFIDYPNWSDMYELMKSGYVFGKFRKIDYQNSEKRLSIFVDSQVFDSWNEEVQDGVCRIYDYYSALFNENGKGLSIAFLPQTPKDHQYIMAGAGKHIIGATFSSDNPRDWQLLSHRMFHAFMDTRITLSDSHMPPNLWLTEGLAAYYEIIALDSLPLSLKNKLGINSREEFLAISRRYLYMRLKDAKRLSIIPMQEGQIRSMGQIEFLHYTQAPLIVKMAEDIFYTHNHRHNGFIEYLIQHNCLEGFSMQKIIHYVLGSQGDFFARQFLFQDEILPVWDIAEESAEIRERVLQELNEFEYLLWTWFVIEDSAYPLEEVVEEGMEELSHAAEKKGIHFASSGLEKKVKEFSPTLYHLLMQYALRAAI